MPKNYAIGSRVSSADRGGGPPLPQAQRWRERLGALCNLPPFLKLVWQTSPALTLGSGTSTKWLSTGDRTLPSNRRLVSFWKEGRGRQKLVRYRRGCARHLNPLVMAKRGRARVPALVLERTLRWPGEEESPR